MSVTIIIAIASAVISAVGGIVYREYQHRNAIKGLKAVIEKKNAEIEALHERIKKYGEAAASVPSHNPGNIQL